MLGPVTTRRLDRILRGVSRSIFLTLKVAPRAMRRQLGVGYLFCRAADTIADTRLLSRGERLDALRLFRAQFEAEAPDPLAVASISEHVGTTQKIPEERELLAGLDEPFAAYAALAALDRSLLRTLVTTLTRGMEMDLERFPAEESGQVAALATDQDLDQYTYHVAGCVGEFWTDLQLAHIAALSNWDPPVMRAKGVRFGKGLQMTNILRDVDEDLAIGRIYFPRPRLDDAGVTPEDLRGGRGRSRLKPILDEYVNLTLEHYRAGWEYTLAVPRRVPRLRLACAWPLLIGLRTLAMLSAAEDPYAPGVRIKIPRSEVTSILRRSAARVFSDRALEAMYRGLEKEVSVG